MCVMWCGVCCHGLLYYNIEVRGAVCFVVYAVIVCGEMFVQF